MNETVQRLHLPQWVYRQLLEAKQHIIVSSYQQKLSVYQEGQLIQQYSIGTAINGMGETKDSYRTPRGLHEIRAKIGAGLPLGAVLRGRRWTQEVYSPHLQVQQPGKDWILTRILWLSGLEVGKNRLGDVDTMQRYIYIHGSPPEASMGKPSSRGCIRMRNQDIVDLFNTVHVKTKVYIE